MKIKILVSIAGANFSYKKGDIADFTPNDALELIKKGYAEPINDPVQQADLLPQEKAIGRRRK